MGEMIKLTSKSDGFEFDAYHAPPGDARRGGLIVVQEIFGVTAGIDRNFPRIGIAWNGRNWAARV